MRLTAFLSMVCMMSLTPTVLAQSSNPYSFYAKKLGELLEIERKPNNSPDVIIIRELPDQSTRIILLYKAKNPVLRWCLLRKEDGVIKDFKKLPWKDKVIEPDPALIFSIRDFEEDLNRNILDGDFCVVYSKTGLNDFHVSFSSPDLSSDVTPGAKKIRTIEGLLPE